MMHLILLIVFCFVAACSRAPESSDAVQADPGDPSRILRPAGDDPVAARVDGTLIKRSVLEERVQAQVEQFRRAGRSITPAFEQSARLALLNSLIDRELINAEGRRLGLKVDDDELKRHETLFRERLGTQEAFDGYLARIGRDLSGWGTDQRQHLLQKKVFDRSITLGQASEQQLKARYDKQKKRYMKRRRLRLAELLKRVPSAEALPDKGKRDQAKAEARKLIAGLMRQARSPGSRFAKLAAAHSDSASKGRGGDLGWRIEQSLSPQWVPLLKGAKKNAVVGPFDSPDGIRLLKVIDVQEAVELSFADVREELSREWQGRQRAESERALVVKLRKAAIILVEDHRLKERFELTQPKAKLP
jgi:parvulin-like peptidyl-prolyl isomerase